MEAMGCPIASFSIMYLSSIEWDKKKILLFDVDGTVCDSCQPLADKMASKLNQLGNAHTLVFISGSSVAHLQKQISTKLLVHHHLLGTSGCEYTEVASRHPSEPSTFSSVYHEMLSKSERKEIMNMMEELIQAFDIKSKTTKDDQIQDRQSQITLSAIGRNAPPKDKEKFDPDGSKRRFWSRWLNVQLPSNKYDVRVGGTTSIDITKKGFDKAYGIKRFAEINHFDLTTMLFFGDRLEEGGNDHSVTKIIDSIPVLNPTDTLHHLHSFHVGNI